MIDEENTFGGTPTAHLQYNDNRELDHCALERCGYILMASFIGKTIYGTDTEDPSLVNNSYDTVKKILGLGSITWSYLFLVLKNPQHKYLIHLRTFQKEEERN